MSSRGLSSLWRYFSDLRLLQASTNQRIKIGKRFKSRTDSANYGVLGFRLVKSLKDKSHRDEHGLILLDGWRLINDAFQAGGRPITIYYNNTKLLDHLEFNAPKDCLVYLERSRIKEITSTVTPQGIVAVFEKPHPKDIVYPQANIPLTIICDGLKDPNNMGSIIRSCAGAGCQSIITSKTSVDIWDPKVLRGGTGGHFRIPLVNSTPWDVISDIIPHDTKVYLADGGVKDSERDPHQSTSPYHVQDWTLGPSALVIGQESSGLSDEAKIFGLERNGQFINIPMSNGVDSLSAAMATTVIVFEAVRQHLVKRKNTSETSEPAENQSSST